MHSSSSFQLQSPSKPKKSKVKPALASFQINLAIVSSWVWVKRGEVPTLVIGEVGYSVATPNALVTKGVGFSVSVTKEVDGGGVVGYLVGLPFKPVTKEIGYLVVDGDGVVGYLFLPSLGDTVDKLEPVNLAKKSSLAMATAPTLFSLTKSNEVQSLIAKFALELKSMCFTTSPSKRGSLNAFIIALSQAAYASSLPPLKVGC
mmetsp:Transcript_9638/g.17665  ORF Transcript_9638/g.17665 Transcript_9638/m.17665 type:complete len:203 (+) Transcript_9638:168-776(+)